MIRTGVRLFPDFHRIARLEFTSGEAVEREENFTALGFGIREDGDFKLCRGGDDDGPVAERVRAYGVDEHHVQIGQHERPARGE